MTIEFIDGEPPAKRAGKPGVAAEISEALKAKPGQWAKVKTFPNNKTGNGSSLCASLRRYGCEALTRTENGNSTVYARWPEHDDAPAEVTAIGGTPHTMSERVADIYNTAVANDQSGIKAVMDRFGIGEAGAKAAITKARRAGLIPAPSKGGAA